MTDIPLLIAEMNRYRDERDKADDEVTRLMDSWLQVDERAAGAEYDCGLLRAEIEALEAEIELCPAEGYHTNPAGLEPMPKSDTFLELIVQEGQYSGYYMEDLEATMGTEEFKQWRAWSRGMIVAVHEGRMLVYTQDWAQFKAGGLPLD